MTRALQLHESTAFKTYKTAKEHTNTVLAPPGNRQAQLKPSVRSWASAAASPKEPLKNITPHAKHMRRPIDAMPAQALGSDRASHQNDEKESPPRLQKHAGVPTLSRARKSTAADAVPHAVTTTTAAMPAMPPKALPLINVTFSKHAPQPVRAELVEVEVQVQVEVEGPATHQTKDQESPRTLKDNSRMHRMHNAGMAQRLALP